MAVFGTVATAFHVNIPHTDALIEGRWAFGFLGFALLRHWWAAALLSIPYFSDISFLVGFSGNMAYALPALAVLRGVHHRWLVHLSKEWAYAAAWFLLVLFCYQAFNTPVVWAVIAMMKDLPVWPAALDGWRTQPFLIESIMVGIVSAAGILVVRSHEALRKKDELLSKY